MISKSAKRRIIENLDNRKSYDTAFEYTFLKNGLILVSCLLIGVCNYCHVLYMQESHLTFSHLSTMEREMSFRTEMGFYYSFFKQVIKAPSLQASIHLLTHDNLTEYPMTINALYRFNVYPELTLGIIYRAYMWICDYYKVENVVCYTVNRHKLPPIHSCEGLGEPSIFYVHMVMLLNSLMLPFLFLTSYHISGGSIVGGFMSSLFYFYNHRECTRVQWTPPLRESFSYPFLLMQQFFLLKLFTDSAPSKVYKYGYLVTTILALVSWQFAQFSLLTQCMAVFVAYLVAGDINSRLATQRILTLLLVADLVNVVLQFGNTLLLVGPLRPCIVMALTIVSLEPASFRAYFHNRAWAPVRWVLLTILLLLSTVSLKYTISVLLQVNSDNHMFDILRSKFSNFRSFDSLLYTCAAEFDFYDASSLLELTYTGLLPLSALVVVIVVVYSLIQWWYLCCGTSDGDQHNFLVRSHFCDIGTYFIWLQTMAFTIMAMLIMRLKLFWTPQLCILVSLLCRDGWILDYIMCHVTRLRWCASMKRLGHLGWMVVVVVIVAICSVRGIKNLEAEWAITGSYANWDQEQLLTVIMDTSGPQDSFVGQMATMATVRLVTGRPVTMHPHYEDEALRTRVHVAYSVYSRQSVHQVWLQVRSQLHASRLVYEHAYCQLRLQSPGCSYLEMWDLAEPGHTGRVPLCVLFNEHIATMRLGHGGGGGEAADIGRYFKWRFTSDGGVYTLFEVVPVPLS